MMQLPDTVLNAPGNEAAQDFTDWLEGRLREVSNVPVSPFMARQKVNVLLLEQVSNLLLADEPMRITSPLSVSWDGFLAAWAEFGYRGATVTKG